MKKFFRKFLGIDKIIQRVDMLESDLETAVEDMPSEDKIETICGDYIENSDLCSRVDDLENLDHKQEIEDLQELVNDLQETILTLNEKFVKLEKLVKAKE